MPKTALRQMKILIVEDHDETRRALTELLNSWGFETADAKTFNEGLRQLRDHSFDALIVDIVLPGGSGYQLIREVRERGDKMLGIAISGYDYPSEVKIPKLTGFDYHLSKPCDSNRLRALLEEPAHERNPAIGRATEWN